MEIDLTDARGDVVFLEQCETLLKTDEGFARMRLFVRKFKRQGGEGKTPGDFDQLVTDLKEKAGGDTEEDKLRAFLEGKDDVNFGDLQVTMNNA